MGAFFARRPRQDVTETVFLWPDCLDLWNHWQAVQTQWRTDGGVRTGLDYAGVAAYLASACPKRKRQHKTLEAIREAERAVLEVQAEQQRERAAAKG